jgi:hypothetical protein
VARRVACRRCRAPLSLASITVIPLASILNRIAAVARDINLPRKAVLRFHYALLPNTPPATVPGGRRGHSIMAMSILAKSCEETRRSG